MAKDFVKIFEDFLTDSDKEEIIQNIIDDCKDDGIITHTEHLGQDEEEFPGDGSGDSTYLLMVFGHEDYEKKNNVLFDQNVSDYFCDIRDTIIDAGINLIYCHVKVSIKGSSRKFRILKPERLEQAINIVGDDERVIGVRFTFKI